MSKDFWNLKKKSFVTLLEYELGEDVGGCCIAEGPGTGCIWPSGQHEMPPHC